MASYVSVPMICSLSFLSSSGFVAGAPEVASVAVLAAPAVSAPTVSAVASDGWLLLAACDWDSENRTG